MWHTILADICIFPSLYEPFGLVAIEAMSLGKAVILGYGFPRIFSGDDPDKPTAVFVERDDPDLLASEIINLLHNPDRRQSMGKAAKKFIKKTFSWEKTVAQTIKVYEGAIREND
jgi:glycogen(starch) synthase